MTIGPWKVHNPTPRPSAVSFIAMTPQDTNLFLILSGTGIGRIRQWVVLLVRSSRVRTDRYWSFFSVVQLSNQSENEISTRELQIENVSNNLWYDFRSSNKKVTEKWPRSDSLNCDGGTSLELASSFNCGFALFYCYLTNFAFSIFALCYNLYKTFSLSLSKYFLSDIKLVLQRVPLF